jgi:hypothetical protein
MVLILLSSLALIISYVFIGGGIKYLDEIADQSRRPKIGLWSAWVLTFSLILVTTFWAVLDYFTAILATALTIGLLSTRKVDNYYFIVIAITVLPTGIWILLHLPLLFLLACLIPIIIAVIGDEILHELSQKISAPKIRWILTHRPILKVIVIILPLFGFLTFTHTIAFWSFDVAYDWVAYSHRAPNLLADSTVSS